MLSLAQQGICETTLPMVQKIAAGGRIFSDLQE
jgi:hypothetical protein